MASYPTYDPDVWVGGISQGDLDRLYSAKADTPLLSRATPGLFAPGSTFKPFTTAAALTHGYSTSDQLDCSSSFTVGDRVFKNYESAAYGCSRSPRRCSCPATRSSTASPTRSGSTRAATPATSTSRTRSSRTPSASDSAEDRDRPARRGRRPDRRPEVEAVVLEGQQGLLLQARQAAGQRLPARLRARVLHRRLALPRRRRGQLRDRPGRHAADPAAAGGRVRRDLERRNALGAAGRQGGRRRRRATSSSGSRRR